MKSILPRTGTRGPRLLAAITIAMTLVFAPGMVLGAGKDQHEARAEQRVTEMHTKLKITAPQEAQWAKVATIMRDNSKTMDTLTQARADHAKTMTAVDDLVSYGEIADAHAAGIKKLTPEFAILYASMSDAQKKDADRLFSRGDEKSGANKPAKK